ncbi:hypothetical protein DCO49_04015 [Stenotrophomonas sp. SPM]|nr:hypothetical protein DCO49_04015 [Stenotrophomonas sp. SPM]
MKCSAYIGLTRRGEQDPDHATDAGCGVVGAKCDEVHALREADDLCHGANVAPVAGSLPTMIDHAFQGEA